MRRGGGYQNPEINFRSPNYIAKISAEGKLGLTEFGFVSGESSAQPDGLSCDFNIIKNGKKLACTGTRYCYTSEHWYWCAPSKFRIIEAGRFVNKVDMMDMIFADDDLIGRFEICAMPDCFTLKFDGYSHEGAKGGVEFSLEFPACYVLKKDKHGIIAQKEDGQYLYIATAAQTELDKNRITFSDTEMGLRDEFRGIAVKFYINRRDSDLSVEIISHNQDSLVLRKTPDYDIFDIDMVGNENLDFNIAANRNKYDSVRVRIKNDSDAMQLCPLSFKKEGMAFPVVGMSPMWRDIKTGEPNGIPVQITKDWHIHPDEKECSEWFAIPMNAPRRYLEGKWSHLYSFVPVAPHSEFEGEFVCAFENWGTAPAASHAQLSLIGWGGYDIWEQLALGSHSENICFQADTSSQGVSFIGDVRPIYTRGKHGGFRSYDWAGNIGGGEFLAYENTEGKRIEFGDIKIDFRAQCPVLSRVDYSMLSEDGNIGGELTINAVRTDDVLRIYFNITYTFLKDVSFKRLALFQYDSDRYQANFFRRFACGDGDKILLDTAFVTDDGIENGYNSHYERFADAGKEPWFYFYDTPQKGDPGYEKLSDGHKALCDDKNSTQLIVLRKYDALINGEKRNALYSIRQCYTTDYKHQSVEINPVAAGETVRAGSKVEMCIEFVTIPANLKDYYGTCDYLLGGGDKLNNPACALYQVKNNRLKITGVSGKLKKTYPIVIECSGDECEFTLEGGLGLVPVRFENLSAYSGFSLYANGERVDQSVVGNDFWQTELNEETKTYSLAFSVPNRSGKTKFELKKDKKR